MFAVFGSIRQTMPASLLATQTPSVVPDAARRLDAYLHLVAPARFHQLPKNGRTSRVRAGPQGARRFARCFYGSTNLKSAHQVRPSIVGGSNFRPRSKALPGLITTDSAMPRASPSLSVPVPWPPTRFPRRSTVPFQSVPFARFQLPSPSTITASLPSPCTIRNRTFAAFTARSCGLNGPFTGTRPCLGSGSSRSNRPTLIFYLQSSRVSSRAHLLEAHPGPLGGD